MLLVSLFKVMNLIAFERLLINWAMCRTQSDFTKTTIRILTIPPSSHTVKTQKRQRKMPYQRRQTQFNSRNAPISVGTFRCSFD